MQGNVNRTNFGQDKIRDHFLILWKQKIRLHRTYPVPLTAIWEEEIQWVPGTAVLGKPYQWNFWWLWRIIKTEYSCQSKNDRNHKNSFADSDDAYNLIFNFRNKIHMYTLPENFRNKIHMYTLPFYILCILQRVFVVYYTSAYSIGQSGIPPFLTLTKRLSFLLPLWGKNQLISFTTY